jgi:putative lipoic acid-binding regulatory protein
VNDAGDTVLTFPCRFPVKMMGRDTPEFHAAALRLIEQHAGTPDAADVRTSPSRNGRFVSMTVTIEATSQEQLDAIYRDASAQAEIMVAL